MSLSNVDIFTNHHQIASSKERGTTAKKETLL